MHDFLLTIGQWQSVLITGVDRLSFSFECYSKRCVQPARQTRPNMKTNHRGKYEDVFQEAREETYEKTAWQCALHLGNLCNEKTCEQTVLKLLKIEKDNFLKRKQPKENLIYCMFSPAGEGC